MKSIYDSSVWLISKLSAIHQSNQTGAPGEIHQISVLHKIKTVTLIKREKKNHASGIDCEIFSINERVVLRTLSVVELKFV